MPHLHIGTSSSALNPAHILIARNNRVSTPQANLSAASSPADPLPSNVAASAIFQRSSSSPPWLFEEIAADDPDDALGPETNDNADPIEIDPTFAGEGRWPGTVKIIVEATTFW